MFIDCQYIDYLDFSTFNTSDVTDMAEMFSGCSLLAWLDFSSFNTEKVTDMSNMFYQCKALENITFGESFNTSAVTNMYGMFAECNALKELDLSRFNTANVTNMFGMFLECSALEKINLNSFNTANVTDMTGMFAACAALKELDLTRFNTANTALMTGMFTGCEELTTIYCNDNWNTVVVEDSEDMFYGCTALVGGNGTAYDENMVDVEYARPDGGTTAPGYFTEKEEVIPYSISAVSANEALGDVTLTFDDKDIISKGEKTNSFTVAANAKGHLVATPIDKFTDFVRWNDEAEGFDQAERDITVTGDFNYIATFKKDSFNVSVTVKGVDAGMVDIIGAGKYGRGDKVTLSYKFDDDNYDFDMWLYGENNIKKDESLVIEEIDDDYDVQLVFKAKKYSVTATVTPAEAGIVKGQGDYEYGTDYTLTLEPVEGWELKEWRDGNMALDEKSNVLSGYVYGTIHIDCVMQKKEATAINDVTESQDTNAAPRKLLRNGVLLIERNGNTYTVQGTEMR